MNAIVIEHVALTELPDAWRERLSISREKRVRVVIEEESCEGGGEGAVAFGMWRDREEMSDVDTYVRRLRAPRFEHTGP